MTWILLFLFVITGYFKFVILYLSFLFVHEMGHFFTAYLLGWNTDKIYLYPYGGFSKFNDDINRPLKEEFLVLFMGPFIQTIYYLVLSFFQISDIDICHYSILIFNLLPIYPLDGGKLVCLFFSSFASYKRSYKVTIIISYVILVFLFFVLFYFGFSLQFLLFLLILLFKLYEEARKSSFYFHKFLLERYLKDYHYPKRSIVTSISSMKRNRTHLFYLDGKYKSEKEVLRGIFSRSK